ncbi:MAG: hypothetical protein ACJ76H_12970 [Bacteriovoracaceae bacterium]
MINKILGSQKGMGLLQVLLGFAMVGGGGYLVMKSVEDSNKSITTNMLTDAMNDYATQISMVLSASQACINTFGGQNARNSAVRTTITDAGGFAIINSATNYGTSNVNIEGIKLRDPGVATDDVNVVTGGAGTTYAEITFGKKMKTFFSNRKQVKKIKMWVMTDASSNVTNCYTMADANDSAWTRETPSNNINYTLGNVGVGLQSPTQKLDVLGRVASTTTTGQRMALGGTASEYQIAVNADLPLVFQNSSGTTANVIVNKAKADESFIIKPTATAGTASGLACTASLEGAMRSRQMRIHPSAHGSPVLTVIRSQICSDYGGTWKWRTLKLRKYTIGGGATCTPGLAQKNCTDSRAADQ